MFLSLRATHLLFQSEAISKHNTVTLSAAKGLKDGFFTSFSMIFVEIASSLRSSQ
jgi:hypothetical protein